MVCSSNGFEDMAKTVKTSGLKSGPQNTYDDTAPIWCFCHGDKIVNLERSRNLNYRNSFRKYRFWNVNFILSFFVLFIIFGKKMIFIINELYFKISRTHFITQLNYA